MSTPENSTLVCPMEEPSRYRQSDTYSITYPLVSAHQYAYALKFILVVQIVIISGGIVGNSLNLLAFVRMGLKDCITITFFNLAISDLCFLLLTTFDAAYSVMTVIELDRDDDYAPSLFGIDLSGFQRLFHYISDTFIASSVFISTFLNAQRSLCVILPLHFKGMFTKARSVLILSLIWVYVLIASAVQMSVIRFKNVWDSTNNRSKLVLVEHHSVSYIFKWEEIVDQIVLTAACLILLVAGVVIMSRTLMKSVRFRQTISNPGLDSSHKDSHGLNHEGSDLARTTASHNGVSSKNSLSNTKERQAVIQVVIISLLLIMAFVPAITRQLAVNIEPTLRQEGYDYFWKLYNQIQAIFLEANAAFNFLIYYMYNSKFRQTLFPKRH